RDTYFKRREPCPILVVCGVDPLLFIASTLEVPQGTSEYDWAGGIRGEPYAVITEAVTGLPMPAAAEIVLAGFLHHDKTLPEGPFGEWTGYYASGERAEPVLDVEAIYHRNDPVILGVPPGSRAVARHHQPRVVGTARPGQRAGPQGPQLPDDHRRDPAVGVARPVPDRDRPGRRDEARDPQEVGPPPRAPAGTRRGHPV